MIRRLAALALAAFASAVIGGLAVARHHAQQPIRACLLPSIMPSTGDGRC